MKNDIWDTEEMVKLLQSPDWTITIHPPGGDVDTETLYLVAKGAKPHIGLYLCGFNSQDNVEDPKRSSVEMLELSDGEDSAGGLNTDDEPTCIMYAKVISKLRKAGWVVVPCLKDYF